MIHLDNLVDWTAEFKGYAWKGRFHGVVLASGAGPFDADSLAKKWPFITHLESRGRAIVGDLRAGEVLDEATARLFIEETIMWGGSQHDLLGSFRRANPVGQALLAPVVTRVVEACCGRPSTEHSVRAGFKVAREIPYVGYTYASKLLRFLDPDEFPAVDRRIHEALLKPSGFLTATNTSYVAWQRYVVAKRDELRAHSEAAPGFPWTAARVEMVAFQIATDVLVKRR